MTPEEEENEGNPYPLAISLIQQSLNRDFVLGRRRNGDHVLKILRFNGGLTLILPEEGENHPHTDGRCDIFIHRKFLDQYAKFLHWMVFVFKNPNNQFSIKAQIMLPTRVEAGCEFAKNGYAACFINNPFPEQRGILRRFQGRRSNNGNSANTRISH